MINVYDISLNFTDEVVYDFFEWNKNDEIERIRKISIIKVNGDIFNKIYNGVFKVEEEFLNKIKNKTILYNSSSVVKLKYSVIFTNGKDAIAVMFNNKGVSVMKSKLLLDELDEVIFLSKRLKIYNLKFRLNKFEEYNKFLTRIERERKSFLIKEFNKIKNNKDISKLKYIYYEWCNKEGNDFNLMYNKLIDGLNKWSDKFNDIYNVVKLMYVKK